MRLESVASGRDLVLMRPLPARRWHGGNAGSRYADDPTATTTSGGLA